MVGTTTLRRFARLVSFAQRGLSISSHRQALSALLSLYGKVLPAVGRPDRALWTADVTAGRAGVQSPEALERNPPCGQKLGGLR